MRIYIRGKAAGKRRDMLEKQPLEIPGGIDSAEKLIEHLVRENIRSYNQQNIDAPYFQYLSRQELEDGVYSGKVGFGGRKNERQADEEESARNALQCFSDGIYRVLVNEAEALPGGPLSLNEGDTVTFIRLVMLAGRRF
ncbi:MAG: hypothetical protein LBD48_00570 [Treponema sp.]|jgi:hypothetical protein|nr:hypothetical protein [Treponema sp.]